MRRSGFTLFELILVVGLIGLLSLGLVSRLGGGSAKRLDDAADIVAADLRYAGQRAIATGRVHRWILDLDGQTFRLEEQRPTVPEDPFETPTHSGLLDLAPPDHAVVLEPIANATGKWRWLDEPGVVITALYLGDEEFKDGVVSVGFSGDGGADPAEIELRDEHEFTSFVRVLPFTGEVRVVQGEAR